MASARLDGRSEATGPTRFPRSALAGVLAIGLWAGTTHACPTDAAPRDSGTLLTVQPPTGKLLALTASELAALPAASLTQRQSVSSSTAAGTQRSTSYTGYLLRDVLLGAGVGGPNDRASRLSIVELVATDGYRAVFSWGELFNAAAGDEVIVITAQDGKALDSVAGPLALRSLSDVRPGPRHVRNLCAVLVRR